MSMCHTSPGTSNVLTLTQEATELTPVDTTPIPTQNDAITHRLPHTYTGHAYFGR